LVAVPSEPLSALLYAVLRAADDAGRVLAERLGTGVTDATALQHLLTSGPAGPAELGRLLGLGSAAATVLADRLEAAGHVERTPHPGDRRRRQLAPTDRARADVWAVLEPLVRLLDEVQVGFDDAEQEVVARYLRETAAAYARYDAGR
jgi:DNA-binding MarR family transcriptional regulator